MSDDPTVPLTPDLVLLDIEATDARSVIEALVGRLVAAGRVTDREGYLAAVLAREDETGGTGMESGVAIPHAKHAGVTAPSVAFARVRGGVDFGAIDEDADLVFLIAAPAGADDAHVTVLSRLAQRLVHEDFRTTLRQAEDADAIVAAVAGPATPAAPAEPTTTDAVATGDRPLRLVAVTACPTGIAHSAMAAEAIEVAARRAGHTIDVEIQGAAGGPGLTAATIGAADAVVFAVDAGIRDRERFAGLPTVEVRTREAIDRPDELIARAAEAAATGIRTGRTATASTSPMAAAAPHASKAAQVRIWLMTGVSYMLPFVVAGGILIALGFAIGGATEVTGVEEWPTLGDAFSSKLMFGALIFKIGATAFEMLVPILAGYIAFGMVDRPGIAPGVVAGLLAVQLEAGFLGGIAGGLLAGGIVMLLQRIKVRGTLSKMMPILVYPVIGTLLTGAVMVLIIGPPVADLQSGLTDWLEDLQGSNAVLLGVVIGLMMAFDMGGPVNKAAYAFGIAALDAGNYTVMAAVMAAGMTPPLGLALATVIRPKLFTEEERESGKAAWLLGASFVTEGAIPFAAADPLRVIPAIMAGAATTGALSMAFDAELRAPHGGIFVIGLVDGLAGYIVAIAVGTVVTGLAVVALKSIGRRPAADEAAVVDVTDTSATTTVPTPAPAAV